MRPGYRIPSGSESSLSDSPDVTLGGASFQTVKGRTRSAVPTKISRPRSLASAAQAAKPFGDDVLCVKAIIRRRTAFDPAFLLEICSVGWSALRDEVDRLFIRSKIAHGAGEVRKKSEKGLEYPVY